MRSSLVIIASLSLFLSGVTFAYPSPCLQHIEKFTDGDALQLQECYLNDTHIPDLLAYLADHKEIKKLYLRYNRISNKGAIALASNTNITTLDISWNNVGINGINAL